MHRVQQVVGNRPFIFASPTMSTYQAAELMKRSGVGALPVLECRELVGILSERDLVTRVLVPERDARATAVADVMTREVVTADIGDRTDPCVEKMRTRGCRHLPVLSEGQVVAMLSMRDLLRDEVEERDEEIRHLREYLHQPGPL